MASWRSTKETQQCACCANENYIPTNYKIYDNRIIINENENLCCDCDEFWCTPDGQTLLKERLQIHEGRTCNLCGKKVEEELRGLGPVLHKECIQAINDYINGKPITSREALSTTEIKQIETIQKMNNYKSRMEVPIENTKEKKKNFNIGNNKWICGNTKWSWIKTT
jgi:hypothetical protein